MSFLSGWRSSAAVAIALVGTLLTQQASAQFSGGTTPTPLPPPVKGAVQQAPTMQQVQQLYLLRYLQSRSGGGGVKRGVPQFVPFGQPIMNPAAMMQQQQQQMQPVAPANTTAEKSAGVKAAAERRAEAEAEREQRRKLTRERAEKRKKEAEERRAKAADPA